MFWAAVSQAEGTPRSVDTAIRFNSPGTPASDGTPTLISLFGNPRFKDENLVAYEMGSRTMVFDHLSIDLAAYYNDYSSQQTTEPLLPFLETAPPPAHFVIPFTYGNLMYGESHGFEIAANWRPTDRWTLSPSYDIERFHMHVGAASRDTATAPDTEESDPHLQAQLRSHLDLPHGLGWDASAHFVDRLVFLRVPSYARLDTGLTWRCGEGLTLGVFGQNLARDRHLEFAEATVGSATLVKRSGYVKVTWQF
jgi:iron complex outermembrane receptor protein